MTVITVLSANISGHTENFPKYITNDSHMKSEYFYYKEVNARDGDYYRRWASAYGEYIAEPIDPVLRSARRKEQIRNSNSDFSSFYERFSNIVNYERELHFNKKLDRFLKKQLFNIHR